MSTFGTNNPLERLRTGISDWLRANAGAVLAAKTPKSNPRRVIMVSILSWSLGLSPDR